MHFSTLLSVVPALAITVQAATFNVNVGAFQNGTSGLVFDPNTVAAVVGDNVLFKFFPKAHSVSQSTFANPCVTMPPNATSGAPGGIDSGLMPVAENATTNPTITVNVTVTTPLWFYCKQEGPPVHCGQGMVFAINPPATGNTFPIYLAKAIALNGTTATGTTNTTATGTGKGTGPTSVTTTLGTTTSDSTVLRVGLTIGSTMLLIGWSLIHLV